MQIKNVGLEKLKLINKEIWDIEQSLKNEDNNNDLLKFKYSELIKSKEKLILEYKLKPLF